MDQTFGTESLAAYLPDFLSRQLSARGSLPDGPSASAGWGLLLFIDISGFTRLTEQLGEQGPKGAEALSEILNTHYGTLVDCIIARGGDVIAFAGDAILALWWSEDPLGLPDAAESAAICALEVQARIAVPNSTSNLQLEIRASLGAGSITRFELGGIAGHWHWLVCGEPFTQVSAINSSIEPGQTGMSGNAARLLRSSDSTAVGNQSFRLLNAVTTDSTLSPPGPPIRPSLSARGECLAAFVPAVVSARLAEHQHDFLAEFRRVTVAFINFGDADLSADDIDTLQYTVSTVQQVLSRYEGVLYQYLRDDKGLVGILAFGMPPFSHENDAERATRAVLDVQRALADQFVSAGIATGQVFCGSYGGRYRQQYSLVGSTMNLAARLMGISTGKIRCDQTTANSAMAQLDFTPQQPVALKGMAAPVATFEPRVRSAARGIAYGHRMVGREAELAQLTHQLQRFIDPLDVQQGSPVMVIEAEAGLGKSTLTGTLKAHAEAMGIGVIVGHADAIESQTAYFPFREVIDTATAALSRTPEFIDDFAGMVGEDDQHLTRYLPLLQPFLPDLSFDGEDQTATLTGAIRLEKTNQLLTHLLAFATEGSPTLLVLEDGHWIDSASWSLALDITQTLRNLALLITTRPNQNTVPEYDAVVRQPGVILLELGLLGNEAILSLVASTLGVETLPESLSNLITERATGNPLYAREVALSLRDAGAFRVEEGRVRLDSAVFDHRDVPDTLFGIITNRVDSLPTAVQLTVKVASVIGRSFDLDMLLAIHPEEDDAAALKTQLKVLVATDLIVVESDVIPRSWRFRHAVIEETIYGLLPYAQRRALHASAAAYLSGTSKNERENLLPRLAHHYSEAEMSAEAVGALYAAGTRAVASFANREGVSFLRRALQFESKGQATLSRFDRVQIHCNLSRAHYGLTDYKRMVDHTKTGFREVGRPTLQGGWGIPRELGIWILQGLRELASGRRSPALSGVQRDEHLGVMTALGINLPALLMIGRTTEYLEASLQLHNLGARIEPSGESAVSRSAFGFCLAMMGLKARAARELRRGVTECESIGAVESSIQAHMLLGMFQQMEGDLEKSCESFRSALAALDHSLNPGLSVHQIELQFALVLESLGRTDQAEASFRRAGVSALKAEPQAYGLVLALRGGNQMRAGNLAAGEPLLEEGLKRALDHESPLNRFSALGGIAELELRKGNHESAIKAAFEAELAAHGNSDVNSYIAGLQGYTGLCMVIYDLLGKPDASSADHSTLGAREVRQHARRASRKFERFAKTFVAVRPRFLALEGIRALYLGKPRRASRLWNQAESLAEENGQPFDRDLVRYYRACQQAGREINVWGPK